MAKPTGPTNPELQKLIAELRSKGYKEKIKFLTELADLLEKPTRKHAEVSLGRLERCCSSGETVVVPGKVLSDGILNKRLNVAAFRFSSVAEEKIRKAGGTAISISELVQKNPKGTNVRIMV